ncbi:MAG: class II histone deacetylase [Pseudomonadota bacterium]
MKTGFFWDESCFWHGGGAYALTLPIGPYVQPLVSGGLPENPETKRRLKNLLDVTGLLAELDAKSAPSSSREALLRVHPESYLDDFAAMSASGGGELGRRTPFLVGGYDIATRSAGLAQAAIVQVAEGRLANAYSLSRPPGHHCLPDFPNGFCLLNNIAIGVEDAFAQRLADRVVVIDWDVHHGNGTEAIYLDRADVLTISIHQNRNYPLDTGSFDDRGSGDGDGANINVPLPPGCGHATYIEVMERIVGPAVADFRPDLIVVACGFDAGAFDPLAHMLCSAETFATMTAMTMSWADALCDGKLVLVHEGGYSEAYVPFCGHAAIQTLARSAIEAPDPLAETLRGRQPGADQTAWVSGQITQIVEALGLD